MTLSHRRLQPLLICLALASASAVASQELGYPDIIESLEDVLPTHVVEQMNAASDEDGSTRPDLGRRLMEGNPLLLLVNPKLKGAESSDSSSENALRNTLALEGTTLPDELLLLLGERTNGREAPVYWQLERVFRDYLRLVFAEVEEGDDLQSLVQHKRALQTTLLVVTVDAQLGVQDERLVVKLSNKLWRIELGREAPFTIESAEMLYSDRAIGSVPLPDQNEERLMFAAYRGAVINAISGRLAMSLWGNPALRNNSWMSQRPDPIRSTPLVEPEVDNSQATPERASGQGSGGRR